MLKCSIKQSKWIKMEREKMWKVGPRPWASAEAAARLWMCCTPGASWPLNTQWPHRPHIEEWLRITHLQQILKRWSLSWFLCQWITCSSADTRSQHFARRVSNKLIELHYASSVINQQRPSVLRICTQVQNSKIRPHRRCWGVIFRMALVKGYRFTWGGGHFSAKTSCFW